VAEPGAPRLGLGSVEEECNQAIPSANPAWADYPQKPFALQSLRRYGMSAIDILMVADGERLSLG